MSKKLYSEAVSGESSSDPEPVFLESAPSVSGAATGPDWITEYQTEDEETAFAKALQMSQVCIKTMFRPSGVFLFKFTVLSNCFDRENKWSQNMSRTNGRTEFQEYQSCPKHFSLTK